MGRNGIFLSIHPTFVDRIIAGEKTVELRRRLPANPAVEFAVVYATSPVCAVLAIARVAEIVEAEAERIWEEYGLLAKVTEAEYWDYIGERGTAVGIVFSDIMTFSSPLPLDEVRAGLGWRGPPQSFRYVSVRLADDRMHFTDSKIEPCGGHGSGVTLLTGVRKGSAETQLHRR